LLAFSNQRTERKKKLIANPYAERTGSSEKVCKQVEKMLMFANLKEE